MNTPSLGPVWGDLRFGVRTLRRRPGFALAAVLTLALGIGANTAVFSVFHSVVLQPLPYPGPDRLVTLDETFEGVPGFADGTRIWASYRSFVSWREQATSFEGVAAIRSGGVVLELQDAARSIEAARVTSDYFSLLGVEPILGREFSPEETQGSAAPVTVLSESFWRQVFSADRGVIGRSLVLDGEAKTIVGVMPDGYRNGMTGGALLWTPLWLDEGRWLESDARFLRLVGRLSEAATLEGATDELVAIQSRLAASFPETHANRGAVVRDLHSMVVRNVDARLKLLWGAVGLVLLMATINVASLLFARTLERSSEWRLRTILGAGQGGLLRVSLAEGALLAAAGGILGVGFAAAGVDLLSRVASGALPAGSNLSLDWRVLVYAAMVTVASGFASAAVPTWILAHRRDSTWGLRGSRPVGRLREGLVVVEGALAVLVLVALGLSVRSYSALMELDPGFAPAQMVTLRTPLPETRYPDDRDVRGFYSTLRSHVLELPGVQAAGVIDALPLESGSIWPVFVDGVPLPLPGREPQVNHRFASPGSLAALGVEIVSGRDFTDSDFVEGANVAIVDPLFAEQYWPGEDPLGRQLRHFRDGPWLRVIGVTGSPAPRGLEADLFPTTYAPRNERDMQVVVRSAVPAVELAVQIREAVRSLDPGVPVEEVRTGEMVVKGDVAGRRFDSGVLLIFGVLGLALAAIGVYGSLSALVVQRRAEIGVRRALGETRPSIVGRVLRRTLGLGLIALALGIASSVAMSRVFEGIVYGIPPMDPWTYGVVGALILGSAILAALAPALRAGAISPRDAMREP